MGTGIPTGRAAGIAGPSEGGAAGDDATALLEWLETLEVTSRRLRSLDQLGDGETLLRVMHDLSPEGFPSPDAEDGSRWPPGECVVRLLEGLQAQFRGRGDAGGDTCTQLLKQARGGRPVDPEQITKLVLVATVENDLPRRRHYVEAMLSLSVEAQEAVRAIVERFLGGAGLESPSASPVPTAARSRLCSDAVAFTPPSRSESSRAAGPAPGQFPDFMEVGLDAESRFRRLKQQYISTVEEQERLLEERTALRRELEAERARRREAEEAERVARLELRLAEEARDRVKEEHRGLFELRLEHEVGHCTQRLKQKEDEMEGLREELGLARGQAATAERLANQLELCKQRIEEQQAFRRENEELKLQIDELLSRQGAGAGEHLHRSLGRAREEAAGAARERDEAQRQSELLGEELAREQRARRTATEELQALRRQSGPARGSDAAGGAGPGRALAAEAGAALLAAATLAAQSATPVPQQRSPKGSSVEELRQLLHAQKDDLLERLLVEKERATRAETTLQTKVAEVAALAEQRARDAAQVATLEAKLKELRSGGGGHAAGAEDHGRLQELQGLLALRERELQVHQWRGKAEADSLAAQETLMVSCFHELGLRYQRLKAQNERLQSRLRDEEPPAG